MLPGLYGSSFWTLLGWAHLVVAVVGACLWWGSKWAQQSGLLRRKEKLRTSPLAKGVTLRSSWWTVVAENGENRRGRPFSFFPVILVGWLLLVLYGEVGIHFIHACSFPAETSTTSLEKSLHRILVLADPQLTDPFAYPFLPAWAHPWIAMVCDMQLRRSFKSAVWKAAPDAGVILGDLFWGAPRYSHESEWQNSLVRLNQIYGPPIQSPTMKQQNWMTKLGSGLRFQPRIPMAVVCGNHDLWMYSCESRLDLPRLWTEAFGPLNFRLVFSDGFELVGLAAPILQDAPCPAHEVAQKESQEWLERYRPSLDAAKSTLLINHIPLAAESRLFGDCNLHNRPNARRKDFRLQNGRGLGYENILGPRLTAKILKQIHPSLVLSGDAHDLCYAILDDGATWDVTVPSCSWLEGTFHHGHMLLQVEDGIISSSEICWHPQQMMIYIVYAVAGYLSVGYLLFLLIARDHNWVNFVMRLVLLLLVAFAMFGICSAIF